MYCRCKIQFTAKSTEFNHVFGVSFNAFHVIALSIMSSGLLRCQVIFHLFPTQTLVRLVGLKFFGVADKNLWNKNISFNSFGLFHLFVEPKIKQTKLCRCSKMDGLFASVFSSGVQKPLARQYVFILGWFVANQVEFVFVCVYF